MDGRWTARLIEAQRIILTSGPSPSFIGRGRSCYTAERTSLKFRITWKPRVAGLSGSGESSHELAGLCATVRSTQERFGSRQFLRTSDLHDLPMPMDYFVWVARAGDRSIVIDRFLG